MKKPTFIIPLLLLSTVLLSYSVIPGIAAGWDNDDGDLTITTGGAYSWVTGGYDFEEWGSYSRAPANWYPLDGTDGLTFVVWIKPYTKASSTYQRVIYQKGSTSDTYYAVLVHLDDIGTLIRYNGVSYAAWIEPVITDAGNLLMVVCRWDKDDNSGKVETDIYEVNTTTHSTAESGSGITSTLDADGERFCVSGQETGSNIFEGNVYSVAMYDYKLTDTEVQFLIDFNDPDVFYSDALNFWTFNDGSGATVDDGSEGGGSWHINEYVMIDGETKAESWTNVENVTIQGDASIQTVTPTIPTTEDIAWTYGLLGIALMVSSPMLFLYGQKDGEAEQRAFLFLLMIFGMIAGWGMFLAWIG